MRKVLVAGVAVVALSLAGVRPVSAQLAVVCPTCSTAVEQLVSDGKQALQYTQQLQSYVTQLEQYKNEIQNTISIPVEAFSQIQNDLQQVQSLSNAAALLSGNSGSIIQRLNSAQGYADQAGNTLTNVENIGQQMQQWQQTLGNSAKQLGLTINQAQTAMKTNTGDIATAEQHSQAASGVTQAVQAGTEVAAANSAILAQMAQTNIALAQQISTSQEVDADRRAQEDAAELQFFTPTTANLNGYRSYP